MFMPNYYGEKPQSPAGIIGRILVGGFVGLVIATIIGGNVPAGVAVGIILVGGNQLLVSLYNNKK